MLRIVAAHADIWNVPGPPHASLEFLAERSQVLDQQCTAVGRDPSTVTRSVQMILPGDDAAAARRIVAAVIEGGFRHIVLALRPPWPDNVARWLADEVIIPVREQLPVG
jgi:alkanesulfonate monooxygenase SsuD/methylene tetrahydromethanopterin reductase-like flavin-dependent oxidoreductase (luciferase family)